MNSGVISSVSLVCYQQSYNSFLPPTEFSSFILFYSFNVCESHEFHCIDHNLRTNATWSQPRVPSYRGKCTSFLKIILNHIPQINVVRHEIKNCHRKAAGKKKKPSKYKYFSYSFFLFGIVTSRLLPGTIIFNLWICNLKRQNIYDKLTKLIFVSIFIYIRNR